MPLDRHPKRGKSGADAIHVHAWGRQEPMIVPHAAGAYRIQIFDPFASHGWRDAMPKTVISHFRENCIRNRSKTVRMHPTVIILHLAGYLHLCECTWLDTQSHTLVRVGIPKDSARAGRRARGKTEYSGAPAKNAR